jgi:hypothetical protein
LDEEEEEEVGVISARKHCLLELVCILTRILNSTEIDEGEEEEEEEEEVGWIRTEGPSKISGLNL